MSIHLIPLDDSIQKDDSTLLLGKDIFIKFKPSVSLMDSDKSIQKLINAKNLLQQKEKLENLSKLRNFTDRITKLISESIQVRDILVQNLDEFLDSSFKNEGVEKNKELLEKTRKGVYDKQFGKLRSQVENNSKEIENIEKNMKVYLATDRRLYFCTNCGAYIGIVDEDLPSVCILCKTSTTDQKGSVICRLLDEEKRNYIEGSWLEDYVVRIFRWMGWKAWSRSEVMGSSGVYHEIDVIAVHKESGKVVINECKRTPEEGGVDQLISRFFDIQPNYGILIALNPLDSEKARLLGKKPGLKFINIGNLSDIEVKSLLENYLSSL